MFGLPKDTIQKINNTFKKYPEIEKINIYGSRAKGNYKNGSDIDLSLYGKSIDTTILGKLITELDELPTPYMFDINIYKNITNQDLKSEINKNGKIFYKNTSSHISKIKL